MDISDDTWRLMLRDLILIRAFEEKVKELYNQKVIPGAIHLCIGQEAVAAGICAGRHARADHRPVRRQFTLRRCTCADPGRSVPASIVRAGDGRRGGRQSAVARIPGLP